jgi:hypothetical protein
MVKLKHLLSKIKLPHARISSPIIISVVVLVASIATSLFFISNYKTRFDKLNDQYSALQNLFDKLSSSYDELKNQDQVKTNKDLKLEIDNIHDTFGKAVSSYENLIKFKETTSNTESLDNLFTKSLNFLANQNYASASASLTDLNSKINSEKDKLATASVKIAANVPSSNTAPGSGYSRQSVSSGAGNFMVSMVASDLGNTRVIVDTASDSDCGNNCPVLPLATYVSRNGAFAGVNGTYFCPASYPTCAGKTNTFDLLVMNKNKYYFNSGNNVYSNNPAVIFGNGYIRFVSAASQWGRDTGVDGVLSNFPLLIQGGNVVYGGDSDPKQVSRGARGFVANKGNTVYIGVVHSASVGESAQTLKALGMENALNLDDGGSTALWSGGYKVGPGRDLPNVILFVRK